MKLHLQFLSEEYFLSFHNYSMFSNLNIFGLNIFKRMDLWISKVEVALYNNPSTLEVGKVLQSLYTRGGQSSAIPLH